MSANSDGDSEREQKDLRKSPFRGDVVSKAQLEAWESGKGLVNGGGDKDEEDAGLGDNSTANGSAGDDSASGSLSTGAKAGIGVGVPVLVLAGLGSRAWLVRKKRKASQDVPNRGSGYQKAELDGQSKPAPKDGPKMFRSSLILENLSYLTRCDGLSPCQRCQTARASCRFAEGSALEASSTPQPSEREALLEAILRSRDIEVPKDLDTLRSYSEQLQLANAEEDTSRNHGSVVVDHAPAPQTYVHDQGRTYFDGGSSAWAFFDSVRETVDESPKAARARQTAYRHFVVDPPTLLSNDLRASLMAALPPRSVLDFLATTFFRYSQSNYFSIHPAIFSRKINAFLSGTHEFDPQGNNVLARMGCKVHQAELATTVVGPPIGSLRAVGDIDMSGMTDAFLTASVLAAAASGTTRITGIANQRVKECNRIRAMKEQLAKYGVRCTELEDGIEIVGRAGRLSPPNDGIFCYDDHRIAMSFSVLSTISPSDTVILDRGCVGKTWPGWWDVFSLFKGITLNGAVQTSCLTGPNTQPDNKANPDNTIFIIGMRGAGKTTVGRWAAEVLKRPFVDLDTELEERLGQTIPNMIQGDLGWSGFREAELQLLRDSIKNHADGYVFACGGGILETPEARRLLIQHKERGGYVVWVHRDTEKLVEYLMRDRTRPAFSDNILDVYNNRRPWFEECSNFYYHGRQQEELVECPTELARFLHVMTGQSCHLDRMIAKDQSFFVSLTFPDLYESVDLLDDITVGADAVEIRVDLLKSFDSEFIRDQVSLLRSYTDLPLIYTLRTQGQGGNFVVGKHEDALRLYRIGLELGVEFLDLEVTMPDEVIHQVVSMNAKHGSTTLIASHHDPKGVLTWRNWSWMPYLEMAIEYGNIIKLVGFARNEGDNIDLAHFKVKVLEACQVPIIAINMGHKGRLSRIMNRFLTPVSHPKLSKKVAPGQLSVVEILQAQALNGMIEPKQFFLFGKPIQGSFSPALHNALFRKYNLPHEYVLFETDQVRDLLGIAQSSSFGGASVTIPLKVKALPLLDEVSEAARAIGAVNTIIPISSINNPKKWLFGENTDWKGIVLSLERAGISRWRDTDYGGDALVIGSGGTARAAIYALQSLNFSPISICGRNEASIRALIQAFPPTYGLRALRSARDCPRPRVIISTIPADRPVDETVWVIMEPILRESLPKKDQKTHVFLDMAYGAHQTRLTEVAEESGWQTVPGIEVLVAQGWFQFQYWTRIKPSYSDARAAVINDASNTNKEGDILGGNRSLEARRG
ncbi:hypothetical protein NM208_g3398 [Fusarium decemcellulare]|uniref:Uncharacterized protein n=1 Tax=Fusarium decemcellulare TaxID=57161 RepID=A0ACC1SP75_9HYPO|nr:hypothetical protein NM208_g3398 [Fusarium decemcellulare]